MLVLALLLGLLVALPQLVATSRYAHRSVRPYQDYEYKTAMGNVPLGHLVSSLLIPPSPRKIDGVFGTEMACFIGRPVLLSLYAILFTVWTSQLCLFLGGALLFGSVALGRRTVLWKLVHTLCLRIPARFCYGYSLCIALLCLSLAPLLPRNYLVVILLLQSWDLCSLAVWPMQPYCQRIERPSKAFQSPLTSFLSDKAGRVSGLPYPLRTGQLNHLLTPGYNGGSRLKAMAWLRSVEGGHDVTSTMDPELLNWWGIKWAYSLKPLPSPWALTALPRLYVNTNLPEEPAVPSWASLEHRYG